MLKKETKEKMLKELDKEITNAKSVVFVNFHGLKAGDETILRRDFRNQGVNYKVYRKTLLKRGLEGKALGTLPELSGEVALAYGDDLISPAREVYNFQKSYKGLLNILGGIFEGKFMDSVSMNEIAMIPSREVLYAKFMYVINSPIQRFVIALSEIAKSK